MTAESRELSNPYSSESAEMSQYLTFIVAGEKLAVEILDVKELIEVSHMTKVPMTPDFIRGVINLRGSVIPVVDMSARLGKSISHLSKRSCILLVDVPGEHEKQTIGMLVDEVNEIVEVDQQSIQPPPNFGAEIRTDFIKAMGSIEGEFIILLAIERVLSVSELSMVKPIPPLTPSLKDTSISKEKNCQTELQG